MPTSPNPDLQLYVIGPHWGLPSISPFGIKLATWLRVAGLPHELRFEDDPRKGPKRKSPWIVEHGRVMGDSELVIAHLVETRGVDPDAGLSARDRAVALLLRRTFEEHFHQVLEYALWVLDQGWEHSNVHFDFLPVLVRPLLKQIIRSGCRKEGLVRGVARHADDEIAQMAAADLRAAAELLGDRPFLFGDRPTTTDCTVYGFLAHTLWAPIPYFAKDELERLPSLVAYCERMREQYWPEPASEGPWHPVDAASVGSSVVSRAPAVLASPSP
jgi:glutathione S-transferase